MKPQKVIVFDFGDTLVRLDPPREQILQDFLADQNVHVPLGPLKEAYRIVDYCNKNSSVKLKTGEQKKYFLLRFNKELLKVLGLAGNSSSWPEQMYERFKKKKNWCLFPDTEPMLSRLQGKGQTLSLLANWDTNLVALMEGLGINKYFALITSSAEIGLEKPDSEAFLYHLRALSIEPEEAVYVGNEYETDVVGARRAGIEPILIDRDDLWPHADCVRIRSLSELVSLMEDS